MDQYETHATCLACHIHCTEMCICENKNVIYLVIGILLIVMSQPTIKDLADQKSGNVLNMVSNVSNNPIKI